MGTLGTKGKQRGMRYHIRYVQEGDLPAGSSWAFIESRDALVLVMTPDHSALDLEEMWATYREMAHPALSA